MAADGVGQEGAARPRAGDGGGGGHELAQAGHPVGDRRVDGGQGVAQDDLASGRERKRDPSASSRMIARSAAAASSHGSQGITIGAPLQPLQIFD